MNSGIYVIRGNNKFYIGSTKDFRVRWSQHRGGLRRGEHHNPKLQHAWNKYGEDAFEFSILEYLDNSEELYLAEQFWMDVYQEEGKELYNFGPCARHPQLGTHRSEETKRKMSGSTKGRTMSEEWIQKIVESRKGYTHTEETRRKIGETKKGKKRPPFSEEWCRRLSESRKGKTHSREWVLRQAMASAKPYPSFIHRDTREIIPAGRNLSALCREYNLSRSAMSRVNNGKRKSHKNWVVYNMEE